MRVLVASPLAQIIEPRLAASFEVVTTCDVGELEAFVSSERLSPSVCLLDVLWHTAHDEWTFDGLDAATLLDRFDPPPRLLVALLGHSAEDDYLDEIALHPRYRGAVLKSDPAIERALRNVGELGMQLTSEGLPHVPRVRAFTLAGAFDASPRMARVAGAIASAHSETWRDVGDLTGYSQSAVEKSLGHFARLLVSRGDVPEDARVTVQTLYRWVGEHARYVVSWCRRHGYGEFARRR